MKNCSQKNKLEEKYYCFIKGCIHPVTNLARRSEGDRFTTPYANALAAMAFIHENEFSNAEKIFHPFQRYYQSNEDHFNGLPQIWNVETGLPDSTSIHWEGDAAFLSLALSYYQQKTKTDQNLIEFQSGLTKWLLQRAKDADLIVAESIADMYAALIPWGKDKSIAEILENLKKCFFSSDQICSSDYSHNLNHIIRGFLVFGDTSGFQYYKNFQQTETWEHNGSTKIIAFKFFSNDRFINIETSALLLLALKFRNEIFEYNDFRLCSEIERLTLPSSKNTHAAGIPSFATIRALDQSCRVPALEPTCLMLFYYWGFNPLLLTHK